MTHVDPINVSCIERPGNEFEIAIQFSDNTWWNVGFFEPEDAEKEYKRFCELAPDAKHELYTLQDRFDAEKGWRH